MHPRFSRHAFAGPAIIAGTAMFSGSIFALTVAKMKGLGDKCVSLDQDLELLHTDYHTTESGSWAPSRLWAARF